MRHLFLSLIATWLGGVTASAQSTAPATPEIILPSKQKDGDSRTVATSATPLYLNPLGGIASELVAYFAMDDLKTSGLTWSRKPIMVDARGPVKASEADGRKFFDFKSKGALLAFKPALDLGSRYTLAAWLKAPVPHNHGVIWHGAGAHLILQNKKLLYWHTEKKEGTYAEVATPLDGWIHVAVTCDGNKTQAYLNATPLDSVRGNVSGNLLTIGNHPNSDHHHWMMASAIDEHYIFRRPLRVEEIKKLMAFTPSKP